MTADGVTAGVDRSPRIVHERLTTALTTRLTAVLPPAQIGRP